MNDELKDIINKANAAKKKQDRLIELEEHQTEVPKKKPIDPNSFLVYRRLRITSFNKIGMGWYFMLSLSLLSLFFIGTYKLVYVPLALILFFLLRVAYQVFVLRSGYQVYKNREIGLPFTVEGWNRLVTSEEFLNDEYWRNCKVELTINQSEEVSEEVFQSMLYLFTLEANKYFYTPDEVYTFPKKWKVKNTLTVDGIINCRVAGELYKFIYHQLVSFTKKYPCISKVKITIDPQPMCIPHQMYTGLG